MTTADPVAADRPGPDSPDLAASPSPAGPLGTGRPVASGRGWRVLAGLATALCLAVNVHVVRGTKGPAFPFDEVILLQISRMLAGQQVPDFVQGQGYFPGWSVLVAPLWWFTSDPTTVYRASLWLGIAVSLLTIWPLARIVGRFGLATAPSVVVAAFAMTLPARAVQADFSMSERLVTLLLVCAVLAAFRLDERPSIARHAVFAVVLGLLLFSHVRMSVVLGAAVVWLLLRLPRHRVPSIGGVVMVALAYVLASEAGKALNHALLGRSFSRGDALLERISDARPSLFVRVGIGQSWYQSLASFGLVALALLVVVALVWREVRRWDFGALTFVLGATAAIGLVSLAQWANDFWLFDDQWTRLDAWIYGRYLDPVAAVLAAIGLALLLRGTSRRTAVGAVLLNVGVAVAAIVFVTREVPTWGYVTPAHIPGVLPWHALLPTEPWPREQWIVPSLTNENRIWILAPLCVLLVLVLALLLRRRARLVAGGLVLVAATATVASTAPSAAFHEAEGSWLDVRDRIEALQPLDPDVPVGYARGCGDRAGFTAVGQNFFGYAVAPAPLDDVTATEDVADAMTFVIACDRWVVGEELGARRIEGPSNYASFLWVMPGPLQDRLEEQGRLVAESDLPEVAVTETVPETVAGSAD